MALEPGTRIGPYEIAGLLGVGGMGEVYRAHDERLQRDVALKLIGESASGDPSRTRRMQQEARAVGQLNHPNILGVFDMGTHDDRMYLVTELLEGEPLQKLIARGAIPWRRALALGAAIAEGLAAAHDKGIVHRDIKPDNVFLTADDRIKILDFGVATWRAPGGDGSASAMAATLSQAGLVIGTVGYMSPEQARGQSVDQRTDIFAFGCVLYEMLSGQQAFTGGTPMEVLVAIQRDAPAPLHDRTPGLPADLVRVVERCLEKKPEKRFQTTRDLLFALSLINPSTAGSGPRPALAASDAIARPEPAAPPPRARRRDALVALAGAAIGGAAAWTARALEATPELPSFRQVTFRRGTLYTARFTLDGAGVVFSAAWDGRPRELFATVPGTQEVRSLGHMETDVAGVLGSGEILVIRRRSTGFSHGVLGRMSLAGGPVRQLEADVVWSDSSPDGQTMVMVRHTEKGATLEVTPGGRLFESSSISYPRLSPDGTKIAFLEQATHGDDAGRLVVIARDGKRLFAGERWSSVEGVGWRSPREIWFTAANNGRSLALHAVEIGGRPRMLCRVPGRLVLHDVARDGRVVAERNTYRAVMIAGSAGAPEQDISWQDFPELGHLSRDGKTLLFSERGDGAGGASVVYLRAMDGSPPIRLGEGLGLSLSPDGRQALVSLDEPTPHLEVIPIGPGRPARLPPGPVTTFYWASFVPGAARIVFCGAGADGVKRLYLQELAGGDPRPLPAEHVQVQDDALSPDGSVVAAEMGGRPVLVPLDGGPPRSLPGVAPAEGPIGWSDDGKALFFGKRNAVPLSISRYDLESATITPWRTLSPPDLAGVLTIGSVRIAQNGASWVYQCYRLLSDLYVIDNLR